MRPLRYEELTGLRHRLWTNWDPTLLSRKSQRLYDPRLHDWSRHVNQVRLKAPLPLTPPASTSAEHTSLRRAFIITGIAPQTNTPVLLDKIRSGPLEFLRREKDSLTLNFLASSSANAFFKMYLSEPSQLDAFAGPDAAWAWLPYVPVRPPITLAFAKGCPRRVIGISSLSEERLQSAISFLDEHYPSAVMDRWPFAANRVVFEFFDIADAIHVRPCQCDV
jgi:hypothetical protein